MCRLAAAHKTVRLMLLGLPPDMVHGVSLHRARTSIFRNFSENLKFSKANAEYYFNTLNSFCQEVTRAEYCYKRREE